MSQEKSAYAVAICFHCSWRDHHPKDMESVVGRAQLHHEDTGHEVRATVTYVADFKQEKAGGSR
jgi:hypothetical protein